MTTSDQEHEEQRAAAEVWRWVGATVAVEMVWLAWLAGTFIIGDAPDCPVADGCNGLRNAPSRQDLLWLGGAMALTLCIGALKVIPAWKAWRDATRRCR